jgi:hypothetical protein
MRITALLTVPVLAALIALPTRAPAQGFISVSFGTRLGPEIGVSAYSQQRHGDFQANYRRWTPVTLYDVNGHYYRENVRGARAVQVYSYDNEYFLPPQDNGWNGQDRRYNWRRQPTEADYGRVRPWEHRDAVDPRFGQEIGVQAFSSDRAGDWRRNYRRWTPVTLYEFNGRYYPNNGTGGRAVPMYRYRNEYFLPPTDQDWNGSDRRFNNNGRNGNNGRGNGPPNRQ